MTGLGTAWPEADDAILTRLWAEGVAAAAIGLALGKSKSSVLGRVHRLGLPARAVSPVKSSGNSGGAMEVEIAAGRHPLVRALAEAAREPSPPKVPSKLTAPPGACQWPEGERGAYLFCGDPSVDGRPYCEIHCRAAYLTVRPLASGNAAWWLGRVAP